MSFKRACGWAAILSGIALGDRDRNTAAGAEAPAARLDDYLRQIGYQAIPYSTSDKSKPFVEGKLNEKRYVFLVDTGWGRSTLDERSARGLKTLGDLEAAFDDGPFGTLTNSSIVIMEKLALGGERGAQFLNQPARVTRFRRDHLRILFDGILGYDFMVRNFGLIDCGAHRFYVRPSRATEQQARAMEESLRRSGFMEVEMPLGYAGSLEARINSQLLFLLVDTGSAYTLVDKSQISRLGLKMIKRTETGSLIPKELKSYAIGMGEIGTHELQVSIGNTLQIASREWSEVQLGVSNLKAWGEDMGADAEGGLWQGVLGLDILANHGALLDFSAGKLWFRPEKRQTP